jgi:hypothetical protein
LEFCNRTIAINKIATIVDRIINKVAML